MTTFYRNIILFLYSIFPPSKFSLDCCDSLCCFWYNFAEFGQCSCENLSIMLTVASFEAVVNVILSENDRIHELPDEEIDVVLGCKLSLRKEGVSTTCADVA